MIVLVSVDAALKAGTFKLYTLCQENEKESIRNHVLQLVTLPVEPSASLSGAGVFLYATMRAILRHQC